MCDFNGEFLIVDDDKPSRVLLEKYIMRTSPNVKIDKCTNASEAIRKIDGTKYTGMFIDIGLPDVDGIELMKIAKKHKNRPTFMIFISASILHRKINNISIISKPIKENVIDNVMTEMLVKFSLPDRIDMITENMRRGISNVGHRQIVL